jgi:L-2,4-diaminobutyric acid acetyltransferase
LAGLSKATKLGGTAGMSGSEKVAVRHCVSADVEAVMYFVNSCPPLDLHSSFTYWVTLEYWGEMCFVAMDCEQIIGYVSAIGSGHDDTTFYLWQIGVSGGFRSRGIAQRLIGAVVQAARTHGYHQMQVSIALDNDLSLRAFQRFALSADTTLRQCGEVSFKDARGEAVYEPLYAMEI